MKKLLIFCAIIFNACSAFGYAPFMPVGETYECNAYYDDMHPIFEINKHTCNAGYYMPINYDGCVACPIGYTCAGGTYTFNDTMSQGIELIQNPFVPVGDIVACDTYYDDMHPIFEINKHTCNAGYYMPTNYDGCVACPPGYTCVGGTYTFNETIDQGIELIQKLFVPVGDIVACDAYYGNMHVVFEPNQHTCASGYYMPANYDGCVICPADNYCSGGTYTFNKTTAQGITACGAGTYAPAGMWEAAQCGRILHVGDGFVYLRSTKKTERALHVDLNHDGVADYFGNMTTLDVPMSSGTQRKLKVRWDNVTYSIYDDSVDLSLYQNE